MMRQIGWSKTLGYGMNSTFGYDGDGNRILQTNGGGTYSYLNDVATALPVVLNEQGPDGNITYAYRPRPHRRVQPEIRIRPVDPGYILRWLP